MSLFDKKIKPIVIGICGRSCSGKSRIARKLVEKYPDNTIKINSDKFFKIYNESELNETDGWESPSSIRWDRIIYSIKKLKNGDCTHIPSEGWTEVFDKKVNPKEIIILEGYLIFTNKELLKLLDEKIFVDVSDINILYRRTLRDGNIDGVEYTMNKVIPISKKFEKLQKKSADIIIDGNKSKEEVLEIAEKYLSKYIKNR